MGCSINKSQKGTPLREYGSFEPSSMKIYFMYFMLPYLWWIKIHIYMNLASSLTCIWVTLKGALMKILGYLPICPEAPMGDFYQILHSCRSSGRNHLWQCFWLSVKGRRFCGWSKIVGSQLTKPLAVNTLLTRLRSWVIHTMSSFLARFANYKWPLVADYSRLHAWCTSKTATYQNGHRLKRSQSDTKTAIFT